MHLRHTRRQALTVSLQAPLEKSGSAAEGGSALTLGDVLPDPALMEDDCERRDAAARLRGILRQLPLREQELLTLRYGLTGAPPLTQQQATTHFGISRSYVSRLETRALLRMRALLQAK